MSAASLNRKVHRWGAILSCVPILVVLVTGLLLQLKKEVAWIQPPTAAGSDSPPTISFERILEGARSADVGIDSWEDVDRLDVRPGKGVAKVRGNNRWEVQVNTATGEVVQTAYRRSDLIESLHDGSWFHERAKLGLFLPAAIVLTVLWFTGLYLWFLPMLAKRRRKHKRS